MIKVIIKKVIKYAIPYKHYFIAMYIILFFSFIMDKTLPMLLGKVVDSVTYNVNLNTFLMYAALYTALFMVIKINDFLMLYIWQKLINKYIFDLRIKCFRNILKFDAKYLTDIYTSNVVNIIQNDTMDFQLIIQRNIVRVVQEILGVLISLALIAYVRYEIAIVILILSLIQYFISKPFKDKTLAFATELRDKYGKDSSWLFEMLSNINEIKMFSGVQRSLAFFLNRRQKYIHSDIKKIKNETKYSILIELVKLASLMIIYALSAYYFFINKLEIGQFIAILAYYGSISGDLGRFLERGFQLRERVPAIQRVLGILEGPVETEEKSSIEIKKGIIEFNGVSFSYDRNPVITNASFSISSQDSVGIIGGSGNGKTTLVMLLLRFYDVSSGVIKIDNIPINNYSLQELRESIGVVFQDPIIFEDSIRYNITLKKYDIKDDEIWNILERVNLKEEIEALPEGLDTEICENKFNMSGGQLQRIALARVLAKDPKIIIFDEPTSSLDYKTDNMVIEGIKNSKTDKTTLIISHRMSVFEKNDRMLIVENGTVKDYGNFNDLYMQKKIIGKYMV